MDDGLSRSGPLLGPSESMQGGTLGINPHQIFFMPRWARCGSHKNHVGTRGDQPGTVLGDVVASLNFTWLLSLPTWGSIWMG
jgi:hypothetical protein